MPLFSAFTAFFITIVCILLLKPLALRLGLVDAPNNRKHHQGDIPLIGGLAMFLGFLAGLLTLPISLQHYRSFIAGSALLVFVGLLDDFHELTPKSRFLAQIFALLLIFFWGGIKLTNLGNIIFYREIGLSIYSLPVTIIAGLGVINAINMTDGIDGLAGTLVLTELILLICCALLSDQFIAVHILLLVIVTVLAFLCLNFRLPGRLHAHVFMGDAGSMFLGFSLVWFLIELSQTGSHAIAPVTMLWIMSLPLFDTTAVMLYRISKRKSIFSSDRQHLHHLLTGLNLSAIQISFILGSINLVLGTIGLLTYCQQLAEGILFIGFLTLFVLYFISVTYLRLWLNRKRNSVVFAHLLSKN
ncbi:MAG: MraY family glycosyltransferase [Rickettsia endosymbiont of Ixodes persulcatus]|nr:MraY family glycosyltransferase [Rickettsia endosymbiont of Ixodes persulcatus]